MAEIIPMTEEQKFQLEIYKLVMNQNAAAEEAFQFIGTDELKLSYSKFTSSQAALIQISRPALSKRCVNRRKR